MLTTCVCVVNFPVTATCVIGGPELECRCEKQMWRMYLNKAECVTAGAWERSRVMTVLRCFNKEVTYCK